MQNYYFTFAYNHFTRTGLCLGQRYIKISASSYNNARDIIVAARGYNWSMQYTEGQDFGKERWDLKEISLDNVRL